jgi:hypothetical protein
MLKASRPGYMTPEGGPTPYQKKKAPPAPPKIAPHVAAYQALDNKDAMMIDDCVAKLMLRTKLTTPDDCLELLAALGIFFIGEQDNSDKVGGTYISK